MTEAFQPCLSCGEETAVGTPLFSDRRRIEKSGANIGFVCAECAARIGASKAGEPLTDEQVRRLVDGGSAAAANWGGGRL